MGKPIATTSGTAFAFPDVLQTPVPGGGQAPMPYPNIADLGSASDAEPTVTAGGNPVLTSDSSVDPTTGGEAGTGGGVVQSGAQNGKCTFVTFSATVTAGGKPVVRMGDTTSQNNGNAVGTVLTGVPTVLVGG